MKLRFDYREEFKAATEAWDSTEEESSLSFNSAENIVLEENPFTVPRDQLLAFKDAFILLRQMAEANGDILEYELDEENRIGRLTYICESLVFIPCINEDILNACKMADIINMSIIGKEIQIQILFSIIKEV